MWLTRISIDRPIVILMTMAAILIFGVYGYLHMPADLDPRMDIPVVTVTAVYPGATPAQVEQRVIVPLEDSVAAINGVRGMDATSLENLAVLTIRFQEGTNSDAAAADVKSHVEAARRDLPPEVAAPVIAKVDVNGQPVLVLGVNFARSQAGKSRATILQELTDAAERRVKPLLSRIGGVASVRVIGGWDQEVAVQADPARLQQYGLSITDLLAPMHGASLTVAAGALEDTGQRQPVRIAGEFQSLDEIRHVPIYPRESMGGMGASMGGPGAATSRPPAAPTPVLLSEVAQVSFRTAEPEQLAHIGGRPGVVVQVIRLSEANTVQVVDRVRTVLKDLQERTPAGQQPLSIQVLQDQSEGIRLALEDINGALLLGCLFAVTVVFVFLHSVRDTLIVAMQLPSSITATFGVMWLAGFTLNQMSMLALALAVGILMDDSILVLDSIHRHRDMGKPPRQASLNGRQEIGLADATNTFLDVVIYIPVALMAGTIGMYFKQFGLTVATASLFSLFISFSITPMLAARWFRAEERFGAAKRGFGGWFDRGFERLQRFYRRRLDWALRHRALVMLAGFGSLAAALSLAAGHLGRELTPSVDRGEILIAVETTPGASLELTGQVMARIEQLVAGSAARPDVEIGRMFSRIGESGGGADPFPQRGPIYAELSLPLREKEGLQQWLLRSLSRARLRTRSDQQIAEILQNTLTESNLPEVRRLTVSPVRTLTGRRAPLSLTLVGEEGQAPELARAAAAMGAAFEKIQLPKRGPLLTNVDISYRRGQPELVADVDRERAFELQVAEAEIGQIARIAMAGNDDLRFRRGARVYPVRVQVEPAALRRPQDLGNLIVTQRGGTPVYLDEVAQLVRREGPTRSLRRDRRPVAFVTAELAPGVDLGTAMRTAGKALDELRAQPGSPLAAIRREDVRWGGDVEGMLTSFRDVSWTLIFALGLAYMLMAMLFNSYLHPLTIMLTMPMALVGAVLALLVTHTALSVVAMVGMVMLIGLVSKNSILLVDYTNTLRIRDGMERNPAILAAGPIRLRPILMTTISTTLSTLPVAMGIGRAAEIRAPMGIVAIGGLALSTLLSLIVIPVAYTYADDLTNGLLRGWSRLVGRSDGSGAGGGARPPAPVTGNGKAPAVPAGEEAPDSTLASR